MSRRLLAAHGVLALTSALAVSVAPQPATAAPKPARPAAAQAKALQGPDLRITKQATPDPVTAGQVLTYTLLVTNNGAVPATGFTVVDTLPAGLTQQPMSAGCTYTAANTVTCTVDEDLLVGQTYPLVIQVGVPSGFPAGPIENTATVSLDGQEDDNLADNTVTIATVVQTSADLAVTKVCKPDEPAPAGTQGYCDIIVDNLGPSDAVGAVLTDVLTSASPFTVVSAVVNPGGSPCMVSGSGPVRDATITCGPGTLIAGGRVTVRVTVTANDVSQINDVATVRSATSTPDTSNNKAVGRVDFVGSADLSLTKVGPTSVVAGEQVEYTITVTNAGPSTAHDVLVQDTLPAGVSFVSVDPSTGSCTNGQPNGGELVCGLGDLADDATATILVTGLVAADVVPGTMLFNAAVVSSATADPDNGDVRASVGTTVEGEAVLSVTKLDSPDPVLAGETLTYTVTASNAGPSNAQQVVLTDALPEGTTFVSATDGENVCNLDGTDEVVCALGTLTPGQPETIRITVRVAASAPAGSILTNEVTLSSPTGDTVTAEAATTVATSADLWIDTTAVAFPAQQATGKGDKDKGGEQLAILTTTVHNDEGCESEPGSEPNCGTGGPSDAQNVVTTIRLPLSAGRIEVLFTSPQCSYDRSANTVTCTESTLAVGETVTYVIKVKIKGQGGDVASEGKQKLVITATVRATTPDPNLANNTDTAVLVDKGRG